MILLGIAILLSFGAAFLFLAMAVSDVSTAGAVVYGAAGLLSWAVAYLMAVQGFMTCLA